MPHNFNRRFKFKNCRIFVFSVFAKHSVPGFRQSATLHKLTHSLSLVLCLHFSQLRKAHIQSISPNETPIIPNATSKLIRLENKLDE